MSNNVALTAGPGFTLKTSLGGSDLPPIESGWISRDGFCVGDRFADLQHVSPENFGSLSAQVIGVVFHERRAAFKAAAHHLHGPDQRRGLPVPLCPEAVAAAHQTLHRQAGQLRQPVQVLERGGEGLE